MGDSPRPAHPTWSRTKATRLHRARIAAPTSPRPHLPTPAPMAVSCDGSVTRVSPLAPKDCESWKPSGSREQRRSSPTATKPEPPERRLGAVSPYGCRSDDQVIKALNRDLGYGRVEPETMLLHPDQRGQYRGIVYRERLREQKLVRSMSAKGYSQGHSGKPPRFAG